ncbi:hypothetical protein FPQ18DRAFT_339701 [Pyronema domesticum]|nr:hypothetical protein FPQ18DRAFT_339701 [Pyronema domesticum]
MHSLLHLISLLSLFFVPALASAAALESPDTCLQDYERCNRIFDQPVKPCCEGLVCTRFIKGRVLCRPKKPVDSPAELGVELE